MIYEWTFRWECNDWKVYFELETDPNVGHYPVETEFFLVTPYGEADLKGKITEALCAHFCDVEWPKFYQEWQGEQEIRLALR